MVDEFLRVLDKACQLVQKFDPGSQFYEAQGKKDSGSAATAHDVNNWKFVFRGINNKTNIATCDAGSFAPVEAYPHSWLGDRIIDLPISRGLTDAVTRLRAAGYEERFSVVLLKWPLYPGSKASYIFSIQGSYVFVSLDDGVVIS
jgi:hypothetical protein